MSLQQQENSTVSSLQAPIIDEPGYLQVFTTGITMFVCRSLIVRDDDEIYKRVLELSGGVEPMCRKTVRDPMMVLGTAEWLIYPMPGVPQTN